MPVFSADGVVWAQFDAAIALNNYFTAEPDRWGFVIQPLNKTTPAVAQRMDVFDWSEGIDTDLYPHFCHYKNADGQGPRISHIVVTTDTRKLDWSCVLEESARLAHRGTVSGSNGREINEYG